LPLKKYYAFQFQKFNSIFNELTVCEVNAEFSVGVQDGGRGGLVGGRPVTLDGGLQVSGKAAGNDLKRIKK
jgi:hypothetical protein